VGLFAQIGRPPNNIIPPLLDGGNHGAMVCIVVKVYAVAHSHRVGRFNAGQSEFSPYSTFKQNTIISTHRIPTARGFYDYAFQNLIFDKASTKSALLNVACINN
jgi:hypothetical protein